MFLRLCRIPGNWQALLLGVCLLLAWPAAAQVAPSPPSLASPTAPADTSAAVRRLFAVRRSGNMERIVATGFLVVLGNYALAYSKHETTGQKVGTGLIIAALGYEVFSLARGLAWRQRYSPAQEQALLAALAQGQPLPRQVRRRLKAEYFSSPVPAR